MTKTQLRILKLEKKEQGARRMQKYGIRVAILLLEMSVIVQRMFFTLVHGKHKTFERFARRNEFGSYSESFTSHERFHAASIAAFFMVIVFAAAYAATGFIAPAEQQVLGIATYTVTDNASAGDGSCDGSCTLRDAILAANASGGQDDIIFTAGMTITLAAPLPTITEAVAIDGDVDNDGVPDVVINGAGAGATDALVITSDGNTISGLVIQGFSGNGVTITGSTNVVAGNYIGTNGAGTAASANTGNGIEILDDGTLSEDNIVGGDTATTRNIISGNGGAGVLLNGDLVQGNTVKGNYIGTNAAGDAALANDEGILFDGAATANVIGGTTSGVTCSAPCNVISGNTTADVLIQGGSFGNSVQGNVIGLTADMAKPIAWNNDGPGVSILEDAYDNTIGGSRDENVAEIGQGNVIGGYAEDSNADDKIDDGEGIHIEADGFDIGFSTGNTILGNLIGLGATGVTQDSYNNVTGAAGADGMNDFRNFTGIDSSADFTIIGDGVSGHGNALAGNMSNITIGAASGIDDVSIEGNYIGVDKTGETAQTIPGFVANGPFKFYYGINAFGTDGLVVRDNIISGFRKTTLSSNTIFGYALLLGNQGVTSPTGDNTNAIIAGNKFGTDKDGVTGVGNYSSIACEQLSDSIIGGVADADRNIISTSGEGASGGPLEVPLISESGGCHDVTIQNNYIGTDITGNNALRNMNSMNLINSAHDITITDNLFGDFESGALSLSRVDAITVTDNTVTISADGDTVFHNEGIGSVKVNHSTNITFDGNTFAGHHGLSVESSHDVDVTNNFVGTNAAEDKDYAMLEGISVINSWNTNVTGNLIKNGQDSPLNKYLVANTPFRYGGNDYNEMVGTGDYICDTGQEGMHTVYYSSILGTVETASICGTSQAFSGITYIPSYEALLSTTVTANLITAAGKHHTFLISQSSGGPYTCAALATALSGTCDKSFTLFNLDGSDYEAATLPGDVAVVAGSEAPSMKKYLYPAGVTIFGGNGSVVVQDNTITSNDESGIRIVGGFDNVVDQNTITQNTGNGIDLVDTTTGTVTSNTVTDNDADGIALSLTTGSTIGELTEGNTVTGQGVNGISLVDRSDENQITSNTITGNGDADAGSGVLIDESSDNTVYDNTVNTNGTGITLSSDDAAASDNTIGGVAVNQANSFEDSLADGMVMLGAFTQQNTIAGNTFNSNAGYGINNIRTHSTGNPTPDGGDNLIGSNVVADNDAAGIRNLGASPRIVSSVVSQNTSHGIVNLADYGASTNPSTASDDTVSGPIIGGDGVENTIEGNDLYGIYSLDTAPSNKSTLDTDNTFDDNNLLGRVRQDWYGLVYAELNGDPEEDVTVDIYADSEADPFTSFTTTTTGFGPSDADTADVTTWEIIPEIDVTPTGTAKNYSPHLIIGTGSAGTTTFSFDGVNPTDTGDFGNIDGRYQVATLPMTIAANTIQGTVYDDLDGNASRGDEDGVADVSVTAYLNDDNDNTFYDQNDTVVGTDTTDADGFYSFEDLPQGNFFVKIVSPTGYTITTPNPSEMISMPGEDELRQQDFGVHKDVVDENPDPETATITGKVFTDTDGDGTIDGSEAGIASYSVRLYEDTNASEALEDADELNTTVTTNTSGDYTFTNVEEGSYFVSISVAATKKLTTDNNPSLVKVTATNVNDDFVYDFGLQDKTTPVPPDKPPKPDDKPPIAPTSGGKTVGFVTPHTGASTANSVAASLALGLGLANLILAVGSSIPNLARLLLDLFTEPLLALFGSKKLPWGRAFDSLTKIPIDLGLVRLYDAKSKRLVATAVTDRTGRFKFLPRPGWYTAKAIKIGYSFPSSVLSAAPVYEKQNLYFGDRFKIDDLHQTFNRDIPLDRAETKGDLKTLLHLRSKQALHTIFAFTGIGISIANMVILLSWLTFGLFLVHVILLAIFWRLAMPKKPKPWGMVYDEETKKPIKGAVVRIYDQKFGRLLDVTLSDRNGKFGFLVGTSSYYLTVEAGGYSFPGSKKSTSKDYVGGEIKITEEDKSINYNVPLKKK